MIPENQKERSKNLDLLVSIRFNTDDMDKLNAMIEDDMFESKGSFIRKLIRQEWQRRYQPVRLVSDAVAEVVAVEQSSNSLSD